jgi:DNA-binding MarR family transcriptional regulator
MAIVPTEPTRDLAHQLSRAERLLSGWLSALLENENCTLEEWRVLTILSDGQGHIMTEIADFAMIPAPTLTKLMDRMVSAGLVYRRADDRDRRRVLAYLGDRGRDRTGRPPWRHRRPVPLADSPRRRAHHASSADPGRVRHSQVGRFEFASFLQVRTEPVHLGVACR